MPRKSPKLPELSELELEVVLQLSASDPSHWEPTKAELSAMKAMCKAGTLLERTKEGLPAVPKATYNAFVRFVETARAKATMLSNDDGAIVCTIRQEPAYQFIREEAKYAAKLVTANVLRPANTAKRYLVTLLGYTRYDWDNPTAR